MKNIEDEIPGIINLATTTTLTVIENKIPDANALARKADYDVKTPEIEKKCFSILDSKMTEK